MHETVAKTLEQLTQQSEYDAHVKRLQADGLSNASRNFNSSKVSDHYAIVPTGQAPPSNFGGDHAKLYDMIVRNFLASWHPEAEWNVIKRTTTVAGHEFIKSVETIKSSGWRAVVPKSEKVPEGWGQLPSNPCDTSLEGHEFSEELSKPKNRLKEASLLQLMEHAGKHIEDDDLAEAMKDKGLGTPATRADTIEKLLTRKYIRRSRNGSISAAPHGIRMIDVLRRIPVDWITSPELTGDMESSLLAVQRGDEPMKTYMDKIIQQTTTMVERIREHDRSQLYLEESTIGGCPSCGGDVKENTLAYQCVHNEGRDKGCSFVFWKIPRAAGSTEPAALLACWPLVNLTTFMASSHRQVKVTRHRLFLQKMEKWPVKALQVEEQAKTTKSCAPVQCVTMAPYESHLQHTTAIILIATSGACRT